ncbi:MAG: tripartite tricarboxylate transporter substrate-binding protein [Pseudolabrys sp.]|nr:tripartite tricarboxylate transporter substrate-binding protein [Pseudolabrys sp.]
MVRNSVIALAVALVAFAAPASAQTWPQRPITLIVSQPAGASPDVMARMIAERMSKSLGQTVVIENKPGAGNVVGASAAARSAPDGYTLFFATSAALVTNPYMMKNLPYNPEKDFAPVAFVTRSNQLIVVNPSVEAKTLGELIALEKKSPGKLSLSVDGPRNLAGVTGQALNKFAGTKFVLIPSTNPNAGIQDVMTNRTQAGVFSVSIVEALVQAGSLRAVAVASSQRSASLPNVPAAAETLPGFDFNGWFMLMAPAGTPADIIAKVNAAADAAIKDPQVVALSAKLGFELPKGGVGTPQAAAAFLKEQLALWGKTTKDLGIEPQ